MATPPADQDAHAEIGHDSHDSHDSHRAVDAYGNPPEQPSDWGWNADFGRFARIARWITVNALILMATKSVPHYNDTGTVGLLITAGLLVVGLAWDIHRRRTAWR